MSDYTEKKCPDCGQQLRFPNNVGGIVMACPSCGKKFHSDFKIGTGKKSRHVKVVRQVSAGKQKDVFKYIFELPGRVLERIVRFFSF